jgi:hypothetical protein
MKKIRMKTRDVAIPFRMGAGFPGDVNRSHPASIEPCIIDASAPPTTFGQPVLVDATTQGVRPFTAGDVALTTAYGVTVRPYPFQQSSGSNFGAASLGVATPPATGQMDVLRSGYIMTKLSGATQPVKNGLVCVWTAASSGAHVQGGFEAAVTGGSTTPALPGVTFNGVPDANGNVEVAFNI